MHRDAPHALPVPPAIGYLGVDVLNNATICNEALGLLRAGVPLRIASVYHFENPSFYLSETLAHLSGKVEALYPLGWKEVALALVKGPWVFGWRFWEALCVALFAPAEGWRQHLRMLFHFLPALCLALRWRNQGIRHIHAHWAHTATTIAMHTAALLGVSFSFTGHANDLFVHRVALSTKLRRARFTVCISDYHRQFYRAEGAASERLPVVYCGIDTSRFVASGPNTESLCPRIVSVGRLVEKKGFHDLIAACALLRQRGIDFECVIAGSGPQQAYLEQLVEALDLRGHVTVTGRPVLQEDLPRLLHSARVFALPCVRDREGDMDGLPQVLIEAMACGIPCVSTRLVGIPDLVHDPRNGALVEAGDVPALAEALWPFLLTFDLAQQTGSQAARDVREEFEREETIRRLQALFDWAMHTPGNCPPPFQFEPAGSRDAVHV